MAERTTREIGDDSQAEVEAMVSSDTSGGPASNPDTLAALGYKI